MITLNDSDSTSNYDDGNADIDNRDNHYQRHGRAMSMMTMTVITVR